MKSFPILFLKYLLLFPTVGFSQMSARIGVDQPKLNSTVLKKILLDDSGQFRNKYIRFSKGAEDIKPDENGCYCFDVKDKRFAFVQALFYGSRQIHRYSKLFEKLKVNQFPTLELSLNFLEKGEAPVGAAAENKIELGLIKPNFDRSLLAHEIGHAVFFHIYQDTDPEIKNFIAFLGILEGIANIFAALETKNSLIMRNDWMDAAVNINSFVRFPDLVPLGKDHIVLKINSKLFSRNFPKEISRLKGVLNDPKNAEFLNGPDAYLASASFNQPLWLSSFKFDEELVLMTILKSIPKLKVVKSYQDWSNSLLSSIDNASLKSFLKKEFQLRGLAN